MDISFGKPEKELLNLMSLFTSSIGLGEAAGRVLGALMLAGVPLSQKEISELTEYSPSIVSICLSKLENWGIVRRVGRAGKRKLYATTSTLLDIIEVFFSNIIDKQLSFLTEFIQDHIDSFNEDTKKNAMKILNETRKSRHVLRLTVMLIEKLKSLAPRELLKLFNSFKEKLSSL